MIPVEMIDLILSGQNELGQRLSLVIATGAFEVRFRAVDKTLAIRRTNADGELRYGFFVEAVQFRKANGC